MTHKEKTAALDWFFAADADTLKMAHLMIKTLRATRKYSAMEALVIAHALLTQPPR